MQITVETSKISKTVQRDLTFIFYAPLEYVINFESNLVFLAVENVVSLT